MIRPSVKSVREWSDTFDYYENWNTNINCNCK